MSDKKTTCGPLFSACLKELVGNLTDERVLLFAAGHLTGQAEKVYLDVCDAAMIRPSPEYHQHMLSAAVKLSAIYGLEVSVFGREEIKDEIWIHRKSFDMSSLSWLEVNSPEWHELRGIACGIPAEELDNEFHLRAGYRLPCDKG